MRSLRLTTTLLATVIAQLGWCDSLVNPSFELPSQASGYKYNPSGEGIGWVFNGSSGIEHNGSAFNAAGAPDGLQAGFVQATGSIAQTLNLSAGSYVISFKAAQRSCCVAPYVQPLLVTVDGAQIGALVSPSTTAFATYSIPFMLTSTGLHTIRFAGTDSTDKTTFIDAVVIAPAGPVPTSTTLAGSPNPAAAGANLVFNATVTGNAPSGNVAFAVDGATLAGCAAVSLPAGSANSKSANCGTAVLAVGAHSVVARYSGDAGNQPSSSAALSQMVNAPASSLVNAGFEAPALGSGYRYNPTGVGVGWTFSPGSGIEHNGSAFGAATAPEGVQAAFLQGVGTLSQAIDLNAGSYTLSFKAALRSCCVSPYVQPVRVTVDAAQIGTLVSPATTSFAPYSIPFTIVTSGTHVVAFAGTDSSDKTTFIDGVALVSGSPPPTTTTLASSLNPSSPGASVTFTATVNGSAPSGSVAFSVDGATIAGCLAVSLPTGSASSKNATCAASALSVGTHSVVATYSGDAANKTSGSAVLSQVVSLVGQTITFPLIARQVLGNQPPILNATASSGLSVSFASLTVAVCTVSASMLTLVTEGTCTIRATQSGNATYGPAPPVNQSFAVMAQAQFTSAVTYGVGNMPQGIVLADFNSDGIVDIAVANAFSGSVSILLGVGDGSFAIGGAIQLGGEPIALAVGDFNADGKADLAVADFSGNRVVIFSGKGDGAFIQSAILGLGAAPIAIAVTDLNADGQPDLIAVNGTTGSTRGRTVTVALGNRDGSFRAPSTYATGSSPYGVAVADFNGDGKIDLAVANGDDGTVSVLLGRGDGTFAAPVAYGAHAYPDALAIGDFNGDGRLDLAVANDYSNDISILFGLGDGTFSLAGHVPAGNGPASIAVGDLNGDGISDLAVANRFDNTLAILLGNGDGTFQPSVSYSGFGGQLETVVAKDLNGDGKPDLVVTGAASDTIAVLLNAAVPATPASVTIQSGAVQSAAVGTAYPVPLAVLVKDAAARPLGGIAVTFTAPASGASGTFNGSGNAAHGVSSATGVATSPRFVANAIAGSFTVVASVGSLSAQFAFTNTAVPGLPPAFTSAPPVNGVINVPYNFVLSASGRPSPIFSVSPGLPPGLTLDPATGAISGTPTSTGTFSGTFTATNGVGPSAVQAFSIAVNGVPQTVTFGALPDRSFGDPPFSIGATASSGLPVALASLTPSVCVATSDTLTIVAAGTCTIRATQAGDARFAPAASVDRSFVATRGNQTINFLPATGAVLDGVMSLLGSATSGLPVTFTSLTPAICTVSGTSASFLAVGTCSLRASQSGDANYKPAPSIDQNIAVARSAQTITFWSSGMHPVGTPFPLAAAASSGLPVSFLSLTPATCTVSGHNAAGIAAGTCTIRASQSGDSSYASASADRSFSITNGIVSAPSPIAMGPFIEYSTYFGSSGGDSVFDVIVAPDGSAYVGGAAAATDFLDSATFTNGGLDLLYVARAGLSGQVDFGTLFGGRSADIQGTGGFPYVGALQTGAAAYLGGGQVEAMAGDAAGNIYVAAYAHGTALPVTGGTYLRAGEKSLFRLSASGAIQTISSSIDPAVMTIRALTVDSAGAVYFTGAAGPGLATSANAAIRTMPTPSGPFRTLSAPYLIKLGLGGSTTYSTYLSFPGSRPSSAPGPDQSLMDAASTAYALAVDAAGNAYVAGQATADQFPVTPGSPDTIDTKNRDAFVAKINSAGTALLFVARLGGSDADRATGIALSPDGGVVVGGKTATQPFLGFSNAFQTVVTFAPQSPALERETGFVAKLSADGKQWTALAAIGSSGGNLVANWSPDASPYPVRVAVDSTGAIYAAGTTFVDRTLPTVVNLPDVNPYGAFVMKMTPDARTLLYSTTLGGGIATGLAIDAFGNAFVAGYDNEGIPLIAAELTAATTGNAMPGPFLVKLNDRRGPVALTSDQKSVVAGQPCTLRATLADSRYAGAVEFDEAGQVIGIAPIVAGSAALSTTLTAGIHRLRAVFHGDGLFDGYASPELVLVVAQP